MCNDCRARKINKLFGYEYNPVTLKKIKGIGDYMVQRITCSADKISKLTNLQIDYIIEQVKLKTITSHVSEISETMANTSANDPTQMIILVIPQMLQIILRKKKGRMNRLKRSQPAQAIRSKLRTITTKCSWKIVRRIVCILILHLSR